MVGSGLPYSPTISSLEERAPGSPRQWLAQCQKHTQRCQMLRTPDPCKTKMQVTLFKLLKPGAPDSLQCLKPGAPDSLRCLKPRAPSSLQFRKPEALGVTRGFEPGAPSSISKARSTWLPTMPVPTMPEVRPLQCQVSLVRLGGKLPRQLNTCMLPAWEKGVVAFPFPHPFH